MVGLGPDSELVVEPLERPSSTLLGFELSTVAFGCSDGLGVLLAVRDIPVFRVGVQHLWPVFVSCWAGVVVLPR